MIHAYFKDIPDKFKGIGLFFLILLYIFIFIPLPRKNRHKNTMLNFPEIPQGRRGDLPIWCNSIAVFAIIWSMVEVLTAMMKGRDETLNFPLVWRFLVSAALSIPPSYFYIKGIASKKR